MLLSWASASSSPRTERQAQGQAAGPWSGRSSNGNQSSFPKGLGAFIDSIAPCPWPALGGSSSLRRRPPASRPIYTPEERRRRDASHWTTVQAVLAPLQFIVFLVSLGLVIRFLTTGEGYLVATASIVAKTLILYAIMITGAIWEKDVFGQYLFAPSFFWEDVFSMLVIALQTAYLWALLTGAVGPTGQMTIALAAYATYVVNAGQFLWKLRQARREAPAPAGGAFPDRSVAA
jgi:3-vinyl bacteriochlorophyllide hydratase